MEKPFIVLNVWRIWIKTLALSRESHPKPFIELPDGQTLLKKAYLRIGQLDCVNHIITVTRQELMFKVSDAYTQCQLNLNHSLLLEPIGQILQQPLLPHNYCTNPIQSSSSASLNR